MDSELNATKSDAEVKPAPPRLASGSTSASAGTAPPPLPVSAAAGSPTGAADDGGDAVRFVDLAIEPAVRATLKGILLVLLAAALFIVIMVVVGNLFSFPAGVVVSLSCTVAAAITATMLAVRKRKRQIEECLAKHTEASRLFGALAAALRRGDRKSGFQEAAKLMVSHGHVGGAARLYVDAFPVQIEPLAVEFEPCPLNEVDASFRGIALSADEVNESDERSETRRRFRRAWRMGGLWVNFYVLFQVIVQAYESWQARWFTTRFLIFGSLLIVLLVVQFTRVAPSSNLLLIPGGLLRRRPRWLSAGSGMHIFDPRTSVLIAHLHHGHQWAWTVADAGEQASGLATELEIRTLLRAWLSPLRPPTREMLEGLTGG